MRGANETVSQFLICPSFAPRRLTLLINLWLEPPERQNFVAIPECSGEVPGDGGYGDDVTFLKAAWDEVGESLRKHALEFDSVASPVAISNPHDDTTSHATRSASRGRYPHSRSR